MESRSQEETGVTLYPASSPPDRVLSFNPMQRWDPYAGQGDATRRQRVHGSCRWSSCSLDQQQRAGVFASTLFAGQDQKGKEKRKSHARYRSWYMVASLSLSLHHSPLFLSLSLYSSSPLSMLALSRYISLLAHCTLRPKQSESSSLHDPSSGKRHSMACSRD